MPKTVLLQGLPGGPVQIEFSDQFPYFNTCSKCHGISLSMYTDYQGHIFCKFCLDQCSQERTIFCDQEKKNISFDEMVEAFQVLTALRNMTVYCPNSEQGCKSVCSLVNLQEHFLPCKYTRLACTFCKEDIPGSHYEDHTRFCLEKPVQCPYCYKCQRYGSLEKHKEVCGKQEGICTKCNMIIPRMRLARHEYLCTSNVQPRKTSTDAAAVTDKDVCSSGENFRCNVASTAEQPALSENTACSSGRSEHCETNLTNSHGDVAVIMESPVSHCKPPSTTGADVHHKDAESQTTGFEMTSETSDPLLEEVSMNLKELPKKMQCEINNLVKLLKMTSKHVKDDVNDRPAESSQSFALAQKVVPGSDVYSFDSTQSETAGCAAILVAESAKQVKAVLKVQDTDGAKSSTEANCSPHEDKSCIEMKQCFTGVTYSQSQKETSGEPRCLLTTRASNISLPCSGLVSPSCMSSAPQCIYRERHQGKACQTKVDILPKSLTPQVTNPISSMLSRVMYPELFKN